MRLSAYIAIVLCCFPLVTSTAVPTRGEAVQSETGRLDAAQEPTAFSVLTMAKELAETGKLIASDDVKEVTNEVVRLPLRYRVALTIRRTGYQSAFGDYVDAAIRAWDVWDPQRSSPERELWRTSARLTEAARTAFLQDDPTKAGNLLRERACKPIPLGDHCFLGDLAIYVQFLRWEFETGMVSAALRRLNETDWASGKGWTIEGVKTAYARQMAQALIKAGRANEAFEFLAELRASSTSDKGAIAEAYWRVGADEEGRMLMRDAVTAALIDAEADANKPLPVWMAGIQIAMGDREGGIASLRRLRNVGGLRLNRILPQVAGRLAFAGQDHEAFSLLAGGSEESMLLANIVVGQARRGDFEAAFQTLERLRNAPQPKSREINPGLATPSGAVISIVRNAARAGDTDAFRRAVFMYQEMFRQRGWRGSAPLRDLARVGKGTVALEYALATQSLEEKVSSLCMVAEGLAGLDDANYDPLGFLDGL
jgi:hypothetical protein